jgi:Uma2 family endonuclease
MSTQQNVRVSETGPYIYPDIAPVCGPPQFLDGHRDTIDNPTLLVEVLSPSTEVYDRGRK